MLKNIVLTCANAFMFSLIFIGCGSGDSISKNANGGTSISKKSGFTLAVLPDTQKYARYSPERYNIQTQWIANNYKKENILFTVHLGDVVDRVNVKKEWERAQKAMSTLDKNPKTPYSILAGNHDVFIQGNNDKVDPVGFDNKRDFANAPYLKYFSAQIQKNRFSTFKGHDTTGFNTYHIFKDNDNQEYLVLALDWRTSDETLQWANNVLKSHSNIPTILTTHQILNIDGDGKTAIFTENGKRMWEKLIKDNDQIFLTLNGHHHGEAYMVAKNSFGHDVLMIVVDYQSGFWGGNGMMQLIQFNKVNNKFNIRSFSPWVASIEKSKREPPDQLERWKFSVPMNFQERFSNLNKVQGNIKGTLAYWIFDKEHQITTPDGSVAFSDLSGNGHSMSLKVFPGTTRPKEQLFKVLDKSPEIGNAKGSASFRTDNQRDSQGTFLSAKGIIPSDGKLDQYTIEAIFKISDKWTATANKWSGIFAHQTDEETVCKLHNQPNCGGGDSSVGFFTSSLLELQWLGVPKNGNSRSNWSWELQKEYWYHAVLVNDGKYSTLYVDGSRAMRTAESEQPGLLTNPQGEWTVGVASGNGKYHSLFSGEVSEVRVTNRALKKEEWLNYKK